MLRGSTKIRRVMEKFIKKKKKRKEGIRSSGELELVGRIVDRGNKIKKRREGRKRNIEREFTEERGGL